MPRAAAGRVNLDATSARRLRAMLQTLVRALLLFLLFAFLLFARITKVIPANERSSADTRVVSIVPRITHATRDVLNRAGSSVATRNVQRIAGNLARRVWSHVNGAVPTMSVPWYAVR